jgi:hypothetical protein
VLAFVSSSPTRHGLDPVTASSTAVSSDKSPAALALASSSRSQRARWPTTTLTVSDLPRTVRGRPLASAGVCGGRYSFSYSPTRGRRGGGPRRELQREWEPGIASRRSCWFGPPRTAPPSCGHRVVSGPWAASSVLSCSVLPCWLGQLIRHVPWSAPLCSE